MTTETQLRGADLDAAVAEKIMGWYRNDDEFEWREESGFSVGWASDDDSVWPAFRPSMDIACAWKVVKEMRERGWDFVLEWDHPEALSAVAGFRRIASYGLAYTSRDDATPELAICHAALAAVAEDESSIAESAAANPVANAGPDE